MALKRSRAHQQSRAQRKAARDKIQVLQVKVKEEEAVDWDYDYAEFSDVSFEIKKKRLMVTEPYEFSWEQEGELVDWYQAKPELYDKYHRQFRNTKRRFMMLEDKAKEFPGCTCDQLCQFYKSQRTMYGRLTRSLHKSGSGRKSMTERQQWIVEKWGFINDHIVRVEPNQSTRKFNKERPQRAISSEDELDPHERPSGSTTPTSQEYSTRKQTIVIPTAGCSTTAASQRMIKEIVQQAKATTDTMITMTQPKTSHERIVETFSAFLTQEMLLIPESEWVSFSMEAFALARAHRFPQPH
ncbi:uncharacterized protein LOC116966955 isoform X1 [Amblyraja radiata]|uniref:uncharacterized protein LOC116966955 isoform X1 n=1 Tax=Amblyraja radiata TaxID=386614 RepID=UPI001401FFED|nr:uncharacterized protein LOC116966955 isoform X1 [Amblyraja radiata]